MALHGSDGLIVDEELPGNPRCVVVSQEDREECNNSEECVTAKHNTLKYEKSFLAVKKKEFLDLAIQPTLKNKTKHDKHCGLSSLSHLMVKK